MRSRCRPASAFLVPLLLVSGCVRPPAGSRTVDVKVGASAAPAPGGGSGVESKDVPPQDGVMRIALRTNPPDLDPILVSDTASDGVASKIFDTLLAYDQEMRLVPRLLASMPELSPDGLVYTFHLKHGVKFQNGRELVASDVPYSLARLALTKSKRFNLIEPIVGGKEANAAAMGGQRPELSGVEVTGEYDFRIRLVKPYGPFLYHLAMVNTAPVPKEDVEAKGDRFSRLPVGTGPFRLVEWIENDHIKLARFDDYHLGVPKLAGVLERIIPEPLARQEEYRAGNLELIDVVSGMYAKWKGSTHAADVREWPQLTLEYYGFNLEKQGSPYAGRTDERARKLRQAVNYAVDREHICRDVLEGRYMPANGILPVGTAGHSDRPEYKQDLDKCAQLLAEAGFPEGKGLPSVELFYNQMGDEPAIAQSVQADLTAAHIPVTLKALDWAAFIKAADSGEPAFFRLGWVADYPDPENFLAPLFHSKNKGPQGNCSFYGNPEVDALIDRSYAEVDPATRLATLHEAEEKILADSPWLVLFFQRESVLLKPYVKHFDATPMDDDVNASHFPWHLVELAASGT